MFEVLNRQDDVFQTVSAALGGLAKKPKSKFGLVNKDALSKVLKPLEISTENLVKIENKHQELQKQISNLDEDITLQIEVIVNSQEMLEEGDKTYMEAIINNDNLVIGQAEDDIKQYKNNIHYAEIREKAYQSKLDNLRQELEHVESMKRYVKRGLQAIELGQSKKEYQAHLQTFIDQFKAHKKRVDDFSVEYIGHKREVEAWLLGEIVKGIELGHLF